MSQRYENTMRFDGKMRFGLKEFELRETALRGFDVMRCRSVPIAQIEKNSRNVILNVADTNTIRYEHCKRYAIHHFKC